MPEVDIRPDPSMGQAAKRLVDTINRVRDTRPFKDRSWGSVSFGFGSDTTTQAHIFPNGSKTYALGAAAGFNVRTSEKTEVLVFGSVVKREDGTFVASEALRVGVAEIKPVESPLTSSRVQGGLVEHTSTAGPVEGDAAVDRGEKLLIDFTSQINK